jgi:hypothetical protein
VSVLRIGPLLLALLATILLALGTSVPAAAAHSTRCGNPPNWSGHLIAINVSCHKARSVFHHISCSESQCTEIHSRAWSCYRHRVGSYTATGNCHLGRKRIRWRVYE